MGAVLVSLPHSELPIGPDWEIADDNCVLFSVLSDSGLKWGRQEAGWPQPPHLTAQTDPASELLSAGNTKPTPPRTTPKLHCALLAALSQSLQRNPSCSPGRGWSCPTLPAALTEAGVVQGLPEHPRNSCAQGAASGGARAAA